MLLVGDDLSDQTMAKRLGRELAKIQEENLEWVSCGPVDDNILHWNATIIGEEETPYQGGVFHLDIEFPAEYPFKAPRVGSSRNVPFLSMPLFSFLFLSGSIRHSYLPPQRQV